MGYLLTYSLTNLLTCHTWRLNNGFAPLTKPFAKGNQLTHETRNADQRRAAGGVPDRDR